MLCRIKVPATSVDAPHEPAELAADRHEPHADDDQSEENPYAEFVVYDDEVEWHYAADEDDDAPPPS